MPIKMDSFPLRVFRQSRELMWDPTELDYAKDKADWSKLNDQEKDLMLRMVLGFLIGERGVTHDLAPLQTALRREKGRMEEEMYLTMQLMEEAKHVEFFQLWMNEVLPGQVGKDFPFPQNMYGTLFTVELPRTLGALLSDRTPKAQMRASCLYHMIVEGVIGETGYQVFYGALGENGIMRGLNQGVHHVQRDEVRHIAFGTYFLQRLIMENPDLESFFDEEMERLRPLGSVIVDQLFSSYPKGQMPFGLKEERFREINRQLFESRVNTVKKGQLVAAEA